MNTYIYKYTYIPIQTSFLKIFTDCARLKESHKRAACTSKALFVKF